MGNSSLNTEYGRMSENMSSARLEELCIAENGVQTGPFGSQLHKKDYVQIGTPIITVEHLGENRIIHDNLPRVSDKDKQRLKKYWLKSGDIVFSRVGSVDRRGLVRKTEDGWLFSGRCLRVRPNQEEMDPEYLSYFFGLHAFKDYMRRIAVGATMPSLNTKLLSDVPIYYPPLHEQKIIARILGTLDDKIELNRQMNQILEEMARAIFKSWFVDFDPVHAKQASEKPVETDAEIAVLFPNTFVETELGLVPNGWKVKSIGDIVEAVGGSTPSTKNHKYWEDGIHSFATPKDLSSLYSPVLLETGRKVTDAGLGKISSGLLPEGTVLMSSRAPVGYLAINQFPVCVNQGFIAMKCNGPVSKYYMLNWANHYMPEIKARASGTTFPEISKKNFRPIPVLVPHKDVLNMYDAVVESLYHRIVSNLIENRTLVEVRDILLPKLISGEVRIEGSRE